MANQLFLAKFNTLRQDYLSSFCDSRRWRGDLGRRPPGHGIGRRRHDACQRLPVRQPLFQTRAFGVKSRPAHVDVMLGVQHIDEPSNRGSVRHAATAARRSPARQFGVRQLLPRPQCHRRNVLRALPSEADASPLAVWTAELRSGKTHLLQSVCAVAVERRETSAYLPSAMPGIGPAIVEGWGQFGWVGIDDVQLLVRGAALGAALFRLLL